ncbi:hypothetical protein GobsT_24890 [Gemmata obscuriglobus]|uniref:Uncharacterized protein n=2 Tax=Gemmata obscuriglobus TaxID=114 RepID=A0A2Z3H0G8_9BACT|nr:hypothetical protein C1280_21010 [Gemmata obscuriglobus]QEG27729.1 hypothetical protein GobsT_24890 [Gemmata obscuriglobus]VTS04984.1 unnamed protein product [Gemmata obscuriglobus UQM 2246]
MPDWLIQVVIQYPIVVIVGFVAWYAHRELKAQTKQYLQREDQWSADVGQARRELSEFKNQMIEQSAAVLRGELKRLAKVVDELNKRLGA